MKVKKKSWILGVMLGIGLAALPAWTMTQEEVDAIVDRKILRYVHHDVARGAVRHLESRGATRQMLAEAFAKVLRRDMNDSRGGVGFFKANSAIYWLEETGNDHQLTNLLFVAQMATNSHAGSAIRAYYRRCPDRKLFVKTAEQLLERPNVDGLHTDVWRLLEQESDGEFKSQIVAIAQNHLQRSTVDAYHADKILAACQTGYSKSLRRLEVLRNILRTDRSLSPYLHRAFTDRLIEAEKK